MNEIFGLTVFAGIASIACANVYNEVGDTGDLPGTAQNVGSGINVIAGNIDTSGEVDLYCVQFNFTGNLQIDAVEAVGFTLDMNLHAFNAAGNPLGANDDGSSMGDSFLNSVLTIAITPGVYYFGVGDNNTHATDGAGVLIQDNDTGIEDPNGVLGGWLYNGSRTGAYTIVFSETSVPAPGAAALLGFGGLVVTRRRR